MGTPMSLLPEVTLGDPAAPVPPEIRRERVLDEAALLLVPLLPGDLQGLVRIRRLLESLADAETQPPWVCSAMTRAVALVDEAMLGARPLEAVADELGTLIERVMFDDESVALPPPAAATPPPPAAAAAFALPPEADRDLLPDFVAECFDYLDGAEAALLALEARPDDAESINVVFRAFHTIKGTSAFLGLDPIATLAHHAESFLCPIRDGLAAFSSECADLALGSADAMRALVEQVRIAMDGGAFAMPAGYTALLGSLAAAEARLAGTAPPSPAAPPRLGDILVDAGVVSREEVEEIAAAQGTRLLGDVLVRSGRASEEEVQAALHKQRAGTVLEGGSDSSVRVRTDRLDRLVDLVGELVVAQSMIVQDATVAAERHGALGRKVSHSSKLMRELQDLSMSMRMVPLKALFQKTGRLVRDVARKAGKQVELAAEGEETEIDRTMVDLVTDPLVHMVRNAVDHGLETPAERRAAGKPATGTVRLAAYHSGGSVVLELSDDGRGLDRERLVRKAIERGLIESDKGMSDAEVYNLIFAPGFSTAETVTDLSGRGVGMDVVRRNIEALRGRVDIASAPGRGTTFTIRLPLTLAITEGMLVRVGGERYIVPTVNIHTSFRPQAGALSSVAGRGELVSLHGDVVPVLRLHRIFGVPDAVQCPTRGLLVVIGDVNRRYALLVDELLGQQQFVAKSLGEGLGKIAGVSGGAILGDGHVGLILDPAELISSATRTASAAARADTPYPLAVGHA